MSYVQTSRTYCHVIQKLTRMPWDFLKVGKMNLYGDSRRVFGNTEKNSVYFATKPLFYRS